MRTLHKLHEFQQEAGHAVFNKQQAVAITLRLLETEKNDPDNTDEENRILADAMKKVEFRYLDATQTETDFVLDSLGVARFTVSDIVNAVKNVLFDVK